MLKNPKDRRVRRTRKLLKESLLNLMQEKEFSQISVTDVTEGADMNRATFYLHYTSTTQLLQSVEDELLEEAKELMDAHVQETADKRTVRPILEPVLDFVVEHREVCIILFRNDQVSRFTEHLLELIQYNGVELVAGWLHTEDEQQISYLLEFVTCGLIGLVRVWFQKNMQEPKEKLLATAEQLVNGAMFHLAPTV